MSSLHISLSAEPLFNLHGFTVTNSILTTWIVTGFLILISLYLNRTLKTQGKISGLQLLFEFIIEGLHDLTETIAGSRKTRVFFPFVATFFIFIIVSNWSGILPGVGSIGVVKNVHGETEFVPIFRAPTADINTTLALGFISMVLVQYFGVKYLKLSYFKKFLNFNSFIDFFVGILELISDIAKVISFAFRLFGNIFAGEVLLAVIGYLLPLANSPFLGMEVFVGFIQALVFAMLSLVFFSMATDSHSHES